MTRIIFFSLLLVYSCQIFESREINEISDIEFIEIQDSDYILVDVRTAEEYESGHIQYAVNFDFYSGSFQKEILSLDKSSSIILYCRTGVRSANSCQLMSELGFKNVFNLVGGIVEWNGEINN